MEIIGYDKLRVIADIEIERVLNLKIELKLNKHGRAFINAIVSKDTADAILSNDIKNKEVKIVELDEKGQVQNIPIFSGLISLCEVNEVNGVFTINLTLLTGTYLLDMEKKSRSFQDKNLTYEDVIKKVLSDTPNSGVICNIGTDKKIGKPVIQYMETDWEFIKRMASHVNGTLLPEYTFSKPRLMVGMDNANETYVASEKEFVSGIDQSYFEVSDNNNMGNKEDYLFFLVKSGENFSIGSKINLRNKDYIIYEKYASLEKSQLLFTYKIGNIGLSKRNKFYNSKISGMSLLGTVLKAEGETLKLHLDIDNSQDEGGAFSYKWTPPTGNLMYCMPKVGTRVSLYMGDDDEQNAKVVNCIRTNGGSCKNTSDTSKRSLSTEHGKQLNLHPDNIGFVGNASESSTEALGKLLLDDNKGIILETKKSMAIMALKDINFIAPVINVNTALQMTFLQTGGQVNEASLKNAKASLNLNNRKDLFGDYTKLKGTNCIEYNPFKDAPKKGKLNVGKLVLHAAIGLLAVAAVAALCVVAAPVVLGVSAATATSMAVGAAVGGTVAVGFVVAGDIKSGNVSSIKKYVYKGLGGAISGAVCGYLGPGPGALFKEYLIKSIKGGIAGGFFGTLTECGLNQVFGYEYDVSISDFVNNTIWGGIGGAVAGTISYKIFGAGGSELAKRLAASKDSAKDFIGSVARQNGAVSNGEINRFTAELYNLPKGTGINDLGRAVKNNPMRLLKSSNNEVKPLIIKNGAREGTISGVGGTVASTASQNTKTGKNINDALNSPLDINGSKPIDIYQSTMELILDENSKLSKTIQQALPQYIGG